MSSVGENQASPDVLIEFCTVAVKVYTTALVVLELRGSVNTFEKLPPVQLGDHGAPVNAGLTVIAQVDAPITAPLRVI